MRQLTWVSDSAQQLDDFAKCLVQQLQQNGLLKGVIYLRGDLGAGKTCFARGFLKGLGYLGKIVSPTYTLIEPYEWQQFRVYHLDLYRLNDPLELYHLGLEDYLRQDCYCLIEWPEHAEGQLPMADVECQITVLGSGSRQLQFKLRSNAWYNVLVKLCERGSAP